VNRSIGKGAIGHLFFLLNLGDNSILAQYLIGFVCIISTFLSQVV